MTSSIDTDNEGLARAAYGRSLVFVGVWAALLLFFIFSSHFTDLGFQPAKFFFFLWVSAVVSGLHFSIFLFFLGRFKKPSKLLFVVGVLLQGAGLIEFAFGKFTNTSGLPAFFGWSFLTAIIAFGGCFLYRKRK